MHVTAKIGGTQAKKAQKTVKKAASKISGGAKKAQSKAKSSAKQTKSKAASKSGAGNWYGPDRPKFLGESVGSGCIACQIEVSIRKLFLRSLLTQFLPHRPFHSATIIFVW